MVKRVGGALLVVLPLFVPEVILDFTPLRPDTALLIAGMLPVLTGWVFAPRYALASVPLAALANALAALVFGDPIATTAFVGALAVLVGLSAVKGLHPVAIFIAVQPAVTVISGYHTVSFGEATPGVLGQAVICGAVAALGGLWGVVVAFVLLRDEVSGPPDLVPPQIVVFYTGALVMLLTPTAFVASTWFLGTTAGWILLTILLVTRPTYDESRAMIAGRAVGTVVGGIVAAGIGLLIADTGVLIAVGTAAMVVAAVLQLLHSAYAYFAAFTTAAIVLLNAEHTNVLETDVQRVAFTIVGVVLVAVVVALAEAVLGRHTPAPQKRASTASRSN